MRARAGFAQCEGPADGVPGRISFVPSRGANWLPASGLLGVRPAACPWGRRARPMHTCRSWRSRTRRRIDRGRAVEALVAGNAGASRWSALLTRRTGAIRVPFSEEIDTAAELTARTRPAHIVADVRRGPPFGPFSYYEMNFCIGRRSPGMLCLLLVILCQQREAVGNSYSVLLVPADRDPQLRIANAWTVPNTDSKTRSSSRRN